MARAFVTRCRPRGLGGRSHIRGSARTCFAGTLKGGLGGNFLVAFHLWGDSRRLLVATAGSALKLWPKCTPGQVLGPMFDP
eukprot:4166679-Pyramimonas_sp.AAC.1